MKKRTRQILSLLISAAMLLPLIACTKTPGEPNDYIKPQGFKEGTTMLTGTTYEPSYSREDVPDALSRSTIVADKTSGGLCLTGTSFTLTPSGDTTPAEILTHLLSSPKIDFSCTESGDGTFTLTPSTELIPNTVYRLSFGGENPISSFAFQTENVFALDSAFPANLATDVPVDIGIELRFTEALTAPVGELKKYIKLSPSAEGEFILYPDRKTVVFAPTNKLKTNTVYTVEISSEISGIGGKSLGEDVNIKFRTSPEEVDKSTTKVSFKFTNSMPIFAPGEAMFLSYNMSYSGNGTLKDFTHRNADVKIYKYASASDAVDAMRDFLAVSGDYYFNDEIYKYPTRGLKLVLDTEVTPTSQNSGYYSARYLELPTLDEGVYLVCVTPEVASGNTKFSGEIQALLQVSDYAVYTESSADTLVWVNSVTGKDTEGISVKAEIFRAADGWDTDEEATAYTTVNAKTNGDGIAIIDTSAAPDANRAFITVDNSLIICAGGINSSVKRAEYASWIYTDRDTYFSSDRVNFTGYVSPLDGGELPEYVYLTTSLSSGKQKIEVNEDGYFSGSFEFEDFAASYRSMIRMNFTDGDGNTVKSTYVRVTSEDKPVYTASLAFDRIFYEFGDKGTLTLTSSFFDGTPAPGLTFEVYLPFVGNRTLVTDERGVAELSFTCGRYQTGSTSPSTIYASAYLSGYEGSYLEVGASTVYFQSENHLRIEKDSGGDEITVRLNKFDTSPIKSAEDLRWDVFPDNCIGDAADGLISVTLKKITYVRTESSSQYNPITKKVEKSYYYRSVESTVSNKTYTFKDGVVTLPCFEREDDCSYYYEINYYDARNSSTVRRSIGAVKYTDNYRFDYGDYFSLESSHDYSDRAADGDVVEYTLKYGGHTAAETKILHTVHTATSDSRHYYDITKGGFSLEYTKEYIFGVRVLSVVFDGRNYVTLWVRTPSYDYERHNSLEITVDVNSDSYKPGDECIATIIARGSDGSPASGGIITVGVVDEACFKLGEQTLDPTGTFFAVGSGSPAQNSRFNCFAKYNYYDIFYSVAEDMVENEAATEAPTESGGMKGDDGSADFDSVTVREFFSDNPVFENVRLDENGRATISFTVPDNITSWRITAVGYTPSDDAESVSLGHTKTDVIATLPFFVNATLSDTYVVGDDVSATARVFGTATVSGEEVSYLAELTDYDGNILRSETFKGKAGEFAHVNLGKPEAGSYCLTVKAICGEHSDGVKLPFDVVPDGITMETRRTLKPEEISTLAPTLYPVRLSFVNAKFSDYLDIVYYVNSQGYNRTDTLAARYVSLSALSKIYGTSAEKELDRISSTVRANYTDGLISLMSYAEGDIILSAKIAALTPELIPANRKADMISSFKTAVLDQKYQTNEELAACLLGLSALGEPVLIDIYTLASADISAEAKLYLSLALAILGDYSASRELYGIATDGGLEGEHEINVKASTTEDRIRLTAIALMTASYVDRDVATPMAKYIMSHTSTLDVYSLEMTAYVKNFYPIGAADASFSYTVGDEAHEITLKPAQVHTLTLGKAAFESLEVSAGDDVLVLASYVSGAGEALRDTNEARGAKITKTVEPHDISRGLYKVKISYEITFDSNYECYTLTDRIPSGARYYGAYEEYKNTSVTDRYSYAYLSNDGDQMMHGYIGMYNPTEKYVEGRDERTVHGEVTYLIRAAVSGEFAISPAIIQNCKNGEYAQSGSGTLTIGEDNSTAWKINIRD